MTSTDQDAGNAGQLAPRTAPLALYRRYRPATFAELKGQDHVTEPLRQALRSGRVNHAYLFSGPRGCGKTSSARILARSLNCEEGPTPDPCGKCASCIALAPSGPGSIDVIEIDAASHGGIDDARDLRERAFYSPVSARYKIYIIDEAHMVTGAGFNALLKLVEEPPPHLKFVFATTEPEKVIPTIRSRTHHYPFRLMPPATMRDLLEEILEAEKIEFEPAVLPVVIRAGAGSARDTLSIVDQLIAGADESGLRYDRAIALLGYTDDALLDEMIEAFAAGDGALVFRAIDHVVEGGHDPRRFAMDTLDRLRDLIVLAAIPDASVSGLLDVPEDQLERMRGQASRFGQERLVRAAETINSGLVEMRGATSPRLLLELMCAQVLLPATPAAAPAPASAAPVARRGGEDLDARVDRLERELRTALDRLASASAGAREPERRPARTGPEPRERQRPQADYDRAPAGPADRASARPGRGDADRQQAVSRREPDASGGSRAVGGLDAATLRGRWADILDSIRDIRKVAWLLLSNASVEAVDGDVVTIAFPREGDAKGFGGNGCDQDLATVIERLLGTRPTIRTSVQSASGGGFDDARSSSAPGNVGSRAQPGQAGRARADDPWGDEFQGRPAAAGGSDDQAADGRSSRGRAPAGPVTTAETSGRPSSDERAQPSSKSRKGERQPEDAQGRPGPDAGGSRSSASADDARVTGPRGGGRRSVEADDSSLRDDPRFMTDSDPADSGSDVTGSDLILRELGGKVIEEISEG